MRLTSVLLAVCSLATFPLIGQASHPFPTGANQYEISSIDLWPVPGRPVSIMFAVEEMQSGVIVDRGEGLLARNSEGRVLRHVKWSRPEDFKLFEITDRSSQMNCWIAIKHCYQTPYRLSQWPTLCGTAFGNPGTSLRKIGKYVIDGIAVTDNRETVTCDDHRVLSSDRWLSQELHLELDVYLPRFVGLSRVEIPVYRVKKLSLSEPDPKLFRIPEDFSF